MVGLTASLAEKLLLSVDEAAQVLSVSRDLVYRLVKDRDPATGKPRLDSVKIGSRRLISRRALERFVEGV